MDKLTKLLVAGEIIVNSEAFKNLTKLCDDFGSRFFCTPEDKEAAEFIAKKMREYGLNKVKVEPASYFGWIDGKLTKLWSWHRETATLELLKPTSQKLECISLPFSPSTPINGLTADIFVLESGSREYLLEHKKEIKGKIVLDGNYTPPGAYKFSWDRINLYRPTIYGYLAHLEAAGMLFINRNYGNIPSSGTARFGLIGEIPAIGISRETSDVICRQIKKGTAVANIKIKNKCAQNASAYNVVGELTGNEYPDKIVLVGGHYDGHDIAVGAMDDAAGACVVLETARSLAKHARTLKRTIRFICFGAEEAGLIGSTAYVLNHLKEMKNIELMINTDAAGVSAKTGHTFVVRGPGQLVPKELVSYLEEIMSQLGNFDRTFEVPKITKSDGMTSDHFPFYMQGVPTTCFRDVPQDQRDFLYSHTKADTVDKVDSKGLKDAALILALALIRIADDDKIPVDHVSTSEIVKSLEEKGIAEILRIEKRWLREVSPDQLEAKAQ